MLLNKTSKSIRATFLLWANAPALGVCVCMERSTFLSTRSHQYSRQWVKRTRDMTLSFPSRWMILDSLFIYFFQNKKKWRRKKYPVHNPPAVITIIKAHIMTAKADSAKDSFFYFHLYSYVFFYCLSVCLSVAVIFPPYFYSSSSRRISVPIRLWWTSSINIKRGARVDSLSLRIFHRVWRKRELLEMTRIPPVVLLFWLFPTTSALCST